MAGHSKWANIQHRKKGQDAKRGKLFTKLIREITSAVRQGGGDLANNPRLRTVMDKAFAVNMTKDTIERAIKRGAGDAADGNYEALSYEGYGPGGVAVLVECLTDNRNRTAGEVRHAFSKYGGNLGTSGSVAYLFQKKGQFLFPANYSEEQIMEVALDHGADDVNTDDEGHIEVLCQPEAFSRLQEAFATHNLRSEHAEISFLPATTVAIDIETGRGVVTLIEALEDLDDVQNVYSNADIPDEALGH